MKKIISRIFVGAMLIGAISFCNNIYADQPPDPGGDPTGDPVGGGSPIGSGLVILLSMGAAYGGKKLFDSKKID
jgi:hypothetical protein